jgi:AraC-like DNA-binding protein
MSKKLDKMKTILEELGLEMEFLMPSEDLAPYISVFNFTTWNKKDIPLPAKAGPKIALCISNTENFQSIQNNLKKTVPQAAIVGPVTEPYFVCSNTENLQVIFCEFTETGFYRLFSYDSSALENGYISLLEIPIFGKKTKEPLTKLVNNLLNDLTQANDISSKKIVIENYLRNLISLVYQVDPALASKRADTNLEAIQKAISMIKESRSQIKIQEICQRVEINERTLERWFQKVTGITAKQYISISRFTMLFDAFMQKEGKDLLEEVYSLGYSDQAHAIREFKKYSGFSPGKIIMDKFEFANKLSDNFCKTVPAMD